MSEHEDGGEVGSSLDEGGGVKGVSEGERGGVSASLKKRLMSGPLAWMARNSVAANLAMLVFILGGFMMLGRVKQEVFPEFELDTVSVSIAYPGASPAEVEQGAVLAIEEAVRGLEGIKRVTSTASEGMASVNAELLTGADQDEVLNNVKSAVDRITSFPADSERPTISLLSRRRQVISLVVHGEQSETVLKQLADGIREDLLARPDITLVEVTGVRPPEISVEIPQEKLRRYNLTLEQVSGAIRRASVELPGGGVKTDRGEVLMRTTERRELGQEFDEIIVLSQPDGTSVKLGELADVRDTFQEVDQSLRFDGRPAALVTVYRIGDQTPIELSDAVREYLASREGTLPPGVELDIWDDNSEVYRDRINLLLRNAMQGLILVLLVLGLFLEVRLAFWVTLGIPISFLGAILFMPALDVSLNMISLFAFILTLGIVVDDAIVTGEAVYKHRMDGASPMEAAILGVKEVAMPVTFSVLTTVIAFSPLLFVPGVTGKLFRVIPSIVIPILLLSLFESLFVLPAHLGHSGSESTRGVMGSLARAQRRFARLLERGVERFYVPMAHVVVRQRRQI